MIPTGVFGTCLGSLLAVLRFSGAFVSYIVELRGLPGTLQGLFLSQLLVNVESLLGDFWHAMASV